MNVNVMIFEQKLSVNLQLDSIAVSLFVDWLSLSNRNNNLMMRRAGLSTYSRAETGDRSRCLPVGKDGKREVGGTWSGE